MNYPTAARIREEKKALVGGGIGRAAEKPNTGGRKGSRQKKRGERR